MHKVEAILLIVNLPELIMCSEGRTGNRAILWVSVGVLMRWNMPKRLFFFCSRFSTTRADPAPP